MNGAIPPLPLYVFMPWTAITLYVFQRAVAHSGAEDPAILGCDAVLIGSYRRFEKTNRLNLQGKSVD